MRIRALLAATCCLLALAPPGAAAAADDPVVRLPAPTGRFRVGTVAVHLVDRDRRDPWAPAGHGS
ncbi:hypothetical protein [Actinomadura sp. CNU-125]|uniref:hypothetical protein n=1 Tax=Actinomadura sp. CNU-125 TaxID=1904961 RepID=UPI0021CCA3B2|nr:hypothetical protein [Actinomadura sp. CNU-125]